MENPKAVLIVEDDKLLNNSLKLVLSDEGYIVTSVTKGEPAIEEVKKQFFNVIVLDLMLPDIGGIDLLRIFNKRSPETCCIISTGFASLSSAIEALKAGAYDYIIKPFNVDHLKLVIERGLNKQSLIFKNKELLERLEREKGKLEIILDIYNEISSTFSIEDLSDFVTGKVIQLLEAEKASLMMVDEEKSELVVKGSKGLIRDENEIRVKIGEAIAGWVAKEGEVLLVNEVEKDPRFEKFLHPDKYKTTSFISIPLKVEQKVIGVMNVTDKLASTKVFTEDDLRYLSLIAHQTIAQIENIRLCERLSALAVTDPLTELFNQRYFQEHLTQEIMRASRYGHALSLIMFDIDHFKQSNDKYGHPAGDKVLKQATRVMRENTRHVDIICRYGGDEFMIILPDTDLEGAQFVADKIRKVIETQGLTEAEDGLNLNITLSGGVGAYKKGLSKADFISEVDKALYKAKSEGRNRICTA